MSSTWSKITSFFKPKPTVTHTVTTAPVYKATPSPTGPTTITKVTPSTTTTVTPTTTTSSGRGRRTTTVEAGKLILTDAEAAKLQTVPDYAKVADTTGTTADLIKRTAGVTSTQQISTSGISPGASGPIDVGTARFRSMVVKDEQPTYEPPTMREQLKPTVVFSEIPGWKPTDPNTIVVYTDSMGRTTGETSMEGLDLDKGFDTRARYEVDGQMKYGRELISFDYETPEITRERREISTPLEEAGQLILTADEARKVDVRDRPEIRVLPVGTQDEILKDLLKEKEIDRTPSPFLRKVQVDEVGGIPGFEHRFIEPEIQETGEVKWFESTVVPKREVGQTLRFDIEGYEPIIVSGDYFTSEKKYRPVMQKISDIKADIKVGAIKTWEGYKAAEERLAEKYTRPLGEKLYGKTGLTMGEAATLATSVFDVRESAQQRFRKEFGFPEPKFPKTSIFKEQILKPAIATPFAAVGFIKDRPITGVVALPAIYFAGKTGGLGLGLVTKGTTALSPVVGGVVKAGTIGAGVYFGGGAAIGIGKEYITAPTPWEKGQVIVKKALPFAAAVYGFREGSKLATKLFTPKITTTKVGIRDYRKSFDYAPRKDAKVLQYGRRVVVEPSPIQKFFGRTEPLYKGIYGKDPKGYAAAIKGLKLGGMTETTARELIAFRKPTFRPVDVTPQLSKSLSLAKPELIGIKKDIAVFRTTATQKISIKPDPFRPRVKVIPAQTELFVAQKYTGDKIITRSVGLFGGKEKLVLVKGEKGLVQDFGKIKGKMEFEIAKDSVFKGKGDFLLKDAGKITRLTEFKGPIKPILSKVRLPQTTRVDATSLVEVGKTKTVKGFIKGRPVDILSTKSISIARTEAFPEIIKVRGYVTPKGTKVGPYIKTITSKGEGFRWGVDRQVTLKVVPRGDSLTVKKFDIKPKTFKKFEFKSKTFKDIELKPKDTTLKVFKPDKSFDNIGKDYGTKSKLILKDVKIDDKTVKQITRSTTIAATEAVKSKVIMDATKVTPIKTTPIPKIKTKQLPIMFSFTRTTPESEKRIRVTPIKETQLTPRIEDTTFESRVGTTQLMGTTTILQPEIMPIPSPPISPIITPIPFPRTPRIRVPRRPPFKFKPDPTLPGLPSLEEEEEMFKLLRRRKFRPTKKKAYTVEVRKKGKFVPTGVALEKEEALAFGMKKTLKGAAATFRLRPTAKPIRPMGLSLIPRIASLFRPTRAKRELPLTFVQRREARIITPGEKAEISLRGGRPRKSERRSR